jgi:glutathione S-transferase
MPYVLHNRLGSSGFVVEAGLKLAGLDFRYDPIDSIPSSALTGQVDHVNPWSQVPVLETPEGEILTESSAICIYLVETEEGCREGPHLWCDSRAGLMRWSVFLAVNVYESLLRCIYPDRYATAPADDPDAMAQMRKSLKTAGFARMHQALDVVENAIGEGGFLLGSRLSLVDVYLAMLYAWSQKDPEAPKLVALTRRVATNRALTPIWKRNFGHRLSRDWTSEGAPWG